MVHVGIGYDVHQLVAGRKLILGGVEIPHPKGLDGHSDADALMHAICDAVLGALGEEDIGHFFPNTDPRWKDAPSRVFVEEVFARVKAGGYRVLNCDLTILAERPKLKTFKPAIRANVARLLEVADEQVNVKAGTNEGCDAIGRGEAIAAHAVVLLAR